MNEVLAHDVSGKLCQVALQEAFGQNRRIDELACKSSHAPGSPQLDNQANDIGPKECLARKQMLLLKRLADAILK